MLSYNQYDSVRLTNINETNGGYSMVILRRTEARMLATENENENEKAEAEAEAEYKIAKGWKTFSDKDVKKSLAQMKAHVRKSLENSLVAVASVLSDLKTSEGEIKNATASGSGVNQVGFSAADKNMPFAIIALDNYLKGTMTDTEKNIIKDLAEKYSLQNVRSAENPDITVKKTKKPQRISHTGLNDKGEKIHKDMQGYLDSPAYKNINVTKYVADTLKGLNLSKAYGDVAEMQQAVLFIKFAQKLEQSVCNLFEDAGWTRNREFVKSDAKNADLLKEKQYGLAEPSEDSLKAPNKRNSKFRFHMTNFKPGYVTIGSGTYHAKKDSEDTTLKVTISGGGVKKEAIIEWGKTQGELDAELKTKLGSWWETMVKVAEGAQVTKEMRRPVSRLNEALRRLDRIQSIQEQTEVRLETRRRLARRYSELRLEQRRHSYEAIDVSLGVESNRIIADLHNKLDFGYSKEGYDPNHYYLCGQNVSDGRTSNLTVSVSSDMSAVNSPEDVKFTVMDTGRARRLLFEGTVEELYDCLAGIYADRLDHRYI